MINFKEWIALQENNSPGFAVDRQTPLTRDYRSNPYSFSYGMISPNDENFWLRKGIAPWKDVSGQLVGQWGSAFKKSLADYGNHPGFGANISDPSAFDSIFDLLSKSKNDNSIVKFWTTVVLDPNDNETNTRKKIIRGLISNLMILPSWLFVVLLEDGSWIKDIGLN